jgi:hypothetical protein
MERSPNLSTCGAGDAGGGAAAFNPEVEGVTGTRGDDEATVKDLKMHGIMVMRKLYTRMC